jgi:molybdate transport system ATP-binding protein
MSSDKIICKVYKTLHTADGERPLDLSFTLEKGKLLTLYGPSGSGKTTLLRILAGLTGMEDGHIEAEGEIWYDKASGIDRPARKRPVGMVFQDFALFPHLTVRENLEFALGKDGDRRLVDELIDLMELGPLRDIRPHRLSGGQQQRVALARAVVRRPRLLLLDEPLSALDDEMRFKLQDYILSAHRHYQLTTLLVSHHLPEIFRLSDEVICLEKGRIGRSGPPARVFSNTAINGQQAEINAQHTEISGQFEVSGEILEIAPSDAGFIVSVRSVHSIVRVIATAEEAAALQPGQKVRIGFVPRIL